MKQENECLTCGKCCNYVTVALDEPSDYDDWNQLFWYLHHEKVFVYIDHDGDWFVEFKTKCEQTMSDGRCAVYSERPEVCRDHEADDCENNNCESPYLELFANVDELKEYMQKKEIDLEKLKEKSYAQAEQEKKNEETESEIDQEEKEFEVEPEEELDEEQGEEQDEYEDCEPTICIQGLREETSKV